MENQVYFYYCVIEIDRELWKKKYFFFFEGLVVGAIIRYGFSSSNTIQRLPVVPASTYNETIPPDLLLFQLHENTTSGLKNKTFAYSFRGEIFKQDSEIDKKVWFTRANFTWQVEWKKKTRRR